MKYTCPNGHHSMFRHCPVCAGKQRPAPTRPVRSGPDETGKRYGRLRVIRRHIAKSDRREALWLCVCDCGKEKIAIGSNLRRGQCKSCGCLQVDTLKSRNAARRAKPVILTEAEKAHARYVAEKMLAKVKL